MNLPLAGRTIAVPETRELDALSGLLEERGAIVVACPLVAILDAPDPTPVTHWLDDLSVGRFDDVIFITGEGVQRLLGLASRENRLLEIIRALQRTRKITRGPKPARALKAAGLSTDLSATQPTTDGIIATLQSEELQGRCVGVQLYGCERNENLLSFLESRQATTRCVWPYVYAPASDEQRVVALVEQISGQQIDVIVFTSQAQVSYLLDIAERHSHHEILRQGLGQVRIAAVGPIVAAELQRRGIRVDVVPPRTFSIKALVSELAKLFPAARQLPLASAAFPNRKS